MIGIVNKITAIYKFNDNDVIKTKREYVDSTYSTVAQIIGLLSAQEENIYIFKNYNYQKLLTRIDTITRNDVIELIDRSIFDNQSARNNDLDLLQHDLIYLRSIRKQQEDSKALLTDLDDIKVIDDNILYIDKLIQLATDKYNSLNATLSK